MKLTRWKNGITIILAVAFLAASAQQRRSGERPKPRAATESRTYAPRVIARSDSFILEGTITSIKGGKLTLKTRRGAAYGFELDEYTVVFESGEMVSVATLPDITLAVSDLKPYDVVEIVAERAGDRSLARIVTRISSEADRVARR
jgi:hypothetical protein